MEKNKNPEIENEEKKVVKLYNCDLINRIFRMDLSKIKPNEFTEDELEAAIEETTIYISEYDSLKPLCQSTLKLWDCVMIAFTQQNHYQCKKEDLRREVRISLSDYVDLRAESASKSYKDKIREEVKSDLAILSHISIAGTENQKKKTKGFPKAKICERAELKKQTIIFVFSEELADYLVHSYVMTYPLSLLRTDAKNKNLYSLGRKMALHYGMDNNIAVGTNNKLSVKTALKYCPTIPTKEEVEESNGRIKRRIYESFEKTVAALGFAYEFVMGEEVKDIAYIHNLDIDKYEKLCIRFAIPDIVIQDDRRNRRAAEKAKAKAKKDAG